MPNGEKTRITEVNIIPLKPRNGLVALASCVIVNKFYISSLGIYTKLKEKNGHKVFDGYRLTYPTKKAGRGDLNIFHPVTKECGDAIETEILKKCEDFIGECIGSEDITV